MKEEALVGGTNAVYRIGDKVHRPAASWTPTIHRLLTHARARGVTWVPEPFGYDEHGREVLSFIAGEVLHSVPAWAGSATVLIDIARAMRQWHDATTDYDTTNAVWRVPLSVYPSREVICHNDFAPYNCVFRDGRLVGVIDFEDCSPGSRRWDLAFAAYYFVPLLPPPAAQLDDGGEHRSPYEPSQMRERLDVFLGAYAGGDAEFRYDGTAFLNYAVQRLVAMSVVAKYEHLLVDKQSGTTRVLGRASDSKRYYLHSRWLASQI